MKPGDLVRFDSPGGPSTKVGLIVDKIITSNKYPGVTPERKSFEYKVLFAGVIWSCSYEDLLAEEDWDETR